VLALGVNERRSARGTTDEFIVENTKNEKKAKPLHGSTGTFAVPVALPALMAVPCVLTSGRLGAARGKNGEADQRLIGNSRGLAQNLFGILARDYPILDAALVGAAEDAEESLAFSPLQKREAQRETKTKEKTVRTQKGCSWRSR